MAEFSASLDVNSVHNVGYRPPSPKFSNDRLPTVPTGTHDRVGRGYMWCDRATNGVCGCARNGLIGEPEPCRHGYPQDIFVHGTPLDALPPNGSQILCILR